ncbi:MAG: hypothetical protein RR630_02495 [Coprobacillus sp.]
MKEKLVLNTMKRILKNRKIQVIIVILISFLVIAKFTIAGSFDNLTPKDAIVEYIYNENPGLISFFTLSFVNVETQKIEYVLDSEDKDNYQYYHIVFNGIMPLPEGMGGTFQLSKVGSEYVVTKYLGYEGYC